MSFLVTLYTRVEWWWIIWHRNARVCITKSQRINLNTRILSLQSFDDVLIILLFSKRIPTSFVDLWKFTFSILTILLLGFLSNARPTKYSLNHFWLFNSLELFRNTKKSVYYFSFHCLHWKYFQFRLSIILLLAEATHFKRFSVPTNAEKLFSFKNKSISILNFESFVRLVLFFILIGHYRRTILFTFSRPMFIFSLNDLTKQKKECYFHTQKIPFRIVDRHSGGYEAK